VELLVFNPVGYVQRARDGRLVVDLHVQRILPRQEKPGRLQAASQDNRGKERN